MKLAFTIFTIIVGFGAQAYPKVQVDTLIDFTQEDSVALEKELIILQKIFETDEFWESILNTIFYCSNWRRLHYYRRRNAEYPKLKKDKHIYTSKEIHDLLWNGDDEIGSKNDGIINLKLKAKDYEQNRKGIRRHGGTDKNTLIISSNRITRIHADKKGTYAAHLLHEYMHVLGFKHRKGRPSKTTKKCGGEDVALKIQKIGIRVAKKL